MLPHAQDIFPHAPDGGEIRLGTVGHSDSTSVEDVGDGAGDYSLVRVTLFDHTDRNESADDSPGVAKGRRIVAMISAPNLHVPKLGSVVVVARVADTDVWVILSNPVRNASQFKGGRRSVLDYGDETDVIIRGLSGTLADSEGRSVSLGPDTGFQVLDADACGCQLKAAEWKTFVSKDSDVVGLLSITAAASVLLNKSSSGSVSCLSVSDATIKATGKTFAACTGNVALGANASPLFSVQVGPNPYGPPSTTIFGQP